MDWELAKKIAEQMVAPLNKAANVPGQDFMTLVAAMLLFVVSFDESEKDISEKATLSRPPDLREFYAAARSCLNSMHGAFPPESEKPN